MLLMAAACAAALGLEARHTCTKVAVEGAFQVIFTVRPPVTAALTPVGAETDEGAV